MALESGRPWLSIGCFNPSKRTGVPKLSRGLAGASQASVTALSMKRCSLLLHCGQANDRTSWPHMLGSITVNLMGELQALYSGPWLCLSSIRHPYVEREHATALCHR
jgi:hypothetical protein